MSYRRRMRTEDHGDLRVQYVDSDGPAISSNEDTSDLIGNAWADDASIIAVPVARLDPSFFDLASGVLGDVTQKVVNYRLRLVVIGDISAAIAASRPFADYVRETNRGEHIWFLDDEAALAERLAGRSGR
jgi:hypothetical protein